MEGYKEEGRGGGRKGWVGNEREGFQEKGKRVQCRIGKVEEEVSC